MVKQLEYLSAENVVFLDINIDDKMFFTELPKAFNQVQMRAICRQIHWNDARVLEIFFYFRMVMNRSVIEY